MIHEKSRRHEDRSGGKRWRPHCLRYDSVAPGGLGSLYPCAIFEFGASVSAVVRKYLVAGYAASVSSRYS